MAIVSLQSIAFGVWVARGVVAKQVDKRDEFLFHHRDFQSIIVLGDYLYIDGGDITSWNGEGDGVQTINPQPDDGNIVTLPNNNTYSIDISTSWTPSDVVLNTINKGLAPPINDQALWLSASGKTFYAYDGGMSQALTNWYQNTTPANALWEFTPSGSGGSWSQAAISPSSIFSSLIRVTSAMYAYGNGLGFAIGGWENDATVADFSADDLYLSIPVAGMIVYNDTTQQWQNVSTTGYVTSGIAVSGAAHFVPSFGPEGLLLPFGGQSADEQYISFNEQYMYDPVSREWHSQLVSGDVPQNVENQCVVGVDGDNGTYEIFMYGGEVYEDVANTVLNGAVYVLSLPSFNWKKQQNPLDFGRYFHRCAVAGNRQMISVGGSVLYGNTSSDAFHIIGGAYDRWPHGIGVFDMTEMEWTNSYDANAGSYVTPEIVKDHYNHNGPYPPSWDDPVVEEWLTTPTKNTSSSITSSSSKSTNVGAIAGGVVGGVVLLALIAALAFICMRRRKKKQRQSAYQQQQQQQHYSGMEMRLQSFDPNRRQHRPTELPNTQDPRELEQKNIPAEAASRQFYELEGHKYGQR